MGAPWRLGTGAAAGVLFAAGAALGQIRAPPCVPGPEPSGHPLFGVPTVRVDLEQMGASATHASFGDLNGDGWPDAAVALGLFPGYVSVCMNQGGGVFAAPATYPAGREPCAVEMGDFDHDGHLDLAVVNAQDNIVSILYNRGDGTFGPPVNYAVGQQPRSLKVGDLNGDGWPDIAVLNCLSNDVSVLVNRGDGTFAPEVRVPVGNVTQRGDPNLTFSYPGPFLELGDLNRDGALDIAVPAQDRVKILLNDGAGHFTRPPAVALLGAASAYCIAAGDLNHDGRVDLAVAVTASQDHGLAILMGRGDGTFDPPVYYNADPADNFVFINHVALGDLRGSGNLDVVVGAEEAYGLITLFRNRGDGTLLPKEFVRSDGRSWYVGLVDLTRRGKPDLAVLSPALRCPLHIHLNDGSGTPLGYTFSDIRSGPQHSAAVADLDGDGIADLVVTAVTQDPQVTICRGLGGGRYEQVSTISFGTMAQSTGGWVALADLNGDRRPDLIVTDPFWGGNNRQPGRVWVALNTGGFSFGPPVRYTLDGATPGNVVVADLNGDGRPDLAVWSTQNLPAAPGSPVERRIQVLINRGDGTFDPPATYTIGAWPWGAEGLVAVADLDRDGRPDLVGTGTSGSGTSPGPGDLVTFHNRGDGTFEPWHSLTMNPPPTKLVTADFNGDGWPDVAVLRGRDLRAPPEEPYLTVLFGDGSGGFPARSDSTGSDTIGGEFVFTVGDFNGDGKPDLVFDDGAVRGPMVLLNHGDGTMGRPVAYTAVGPYSHSVQDLIAGDFDGSGRAGLLVFHTVSYVSYLPNLSCRNCYADCDHSATPPVLNAADFACFLRRFVAREPWANCDGSRTAWGAPSLNVLDFMCFLNKFSAGCS